MQNGNQNTEGDVIVREVRDSDRDSIIAIFNYYAQTSYAAYPEMPVNGQFFGFLQQGTLAFFVIEHHSRVVGFGLMKPVLPFPAFMTTGMLTYFIQPEFTGKGYGNRLFERLTREAEKLGMTSLVANMASKNTASIRFHTRHGFTEVGRLHNAGMKFGESFDVIWMQKELPPILVPSSGELKNS
jgi:L-amino acid N-acyltransferase YncA